MLKEKERERRERRDRERERAEGIFICIYHTTIVSRECVLLI